MRLGIVSPFDNLPLIAEAGFDYIEAGFAALTRMTDAEIGDIYEKCSRHGIAAETANQFFGGDFVFYGEKFDADALKAYVTRGMENAKRLGCEIAVIGSGAARSVPEEISTEDAAKRFLEILDICSDTGDRFGIKVAVEPLGRGETNFINTLEDGVNIARRSKNAYCIVDFFHCFMNGEDYSSLDFAKEKLAHVHIARPNADRGVPLAEDMPSCRKWAEMLRAIGYSGRVSFECRYKPDFGTALANSREAIAFLKAF